MRMKIWDLKNPKKQKKEYKSAAESLEYPAKAESNKGALVSLKINSWGDKKN